MAVFDIRSNLRIISSFDGDIDINGLKLGSIVDNADGELGLMFSAYAEEDSGIIDGTHTITFQQSATGAFAGEETTIPDQNLIGNTMVFDNSTGEFITQSQGIFSNLQFVRPVITTTNIGANGLVIVMVSAEGVEQKPNVNDVIGD